MKEVWKPVKGTKGMYAVSNLGRVLSRVKKPPVILKGSKTQDGYYQVTFNGKTHRVHVLVLEAFIKKRPFRHDGCHNDGNPSNNRLDNLRWDTRKNNVADNIKHGTFIYGERQGRATLSNKSVIEIRARFNEGEPQNKLAREFGVSKQHLSRIVNNQRRTKDHLARRKETK